MQCLILAGGLGTRMRTIAGDKPKTLIRVAGRRFADRQLEWLADEGVRRVVYAVGKGGRAVRDFVQDGARWGLRVRYSHDGPTPLGTGGAVRLAVDRGLMDEGFLVLYGDSFLSIDVRALWAASGEGETPVMAVYENDGRWDRSNVVFEDGRVQHMEKGVADPAKAGMHHIDYGMSVLTRDAVQGGVPAARAYDLAELFGDLAAAGDLKGFEATERFYEIGSPQGLADLEALLGD